MSISDFSWIIIVGLGGVAAFVSSIAKLAEDGISEESKKKLQNIVRNYRATPTFRHSFLTFSLISDVYFGERIISFKSFIRSAILSAAWMALISIACIMLLPKYRSWFTEYGIVNLFFEYGLILIAFVIIFDFISVICTRIIVKKSKPSGFFKLALTLALDLLISVLIFYTGFSITKYIFIHPGWLDFKTSIATWVNLDQLPIMLKTLNDLTSDMLKRQPDGSILIEGGWNTEIAYAFPEGIAFYSSLLTSIWLWLHVISYACFKTSLSFDKTKNRFLSIVNIDNKPVASLAIIVLIVYAALIPILIIAYTIFK